MYVEYVNFLGAMRELAMERAGDPAERKRLCIALADPSVLNWMETGNAEALEEWAVALCGKQALKLVRNLINA